MHKYYTIRNAIAKAWLFIGGLSDIILDDIGSDIFQQKKAQANFLVVQTIFFNAVSLWRKHRAFCT